MYQNKESNKYVFFLIFVSGDVFGRISNQTCFLNFYSTNRKNNEIKNVESVSLQLENRKTGQILSYKYVPRFAEPDLAWCERDGLLTYINQFKHNGIIEDPK